MRSNTDVKPVKTFWENYPRPEFWLILVLKVAQKLVLLETQVSWSYKNKANQRDLKAATGL